MHDKADINRYLFYEFGTAGDESQISENWPFTLRFVGMLDPGGTDGEVYEFSAGEDIYFAVTGDGLNFYPTAGMTIEDLRLQVRGARWIGRSNPIDSNTSRIGDDAVPPAMVRRAT